jgi:hypothetical protein
MTSTITDADDGVVLAARGVLTGEREQGTKRIRRVDPEDRSAFVYRVDPDGDPTEVDDENVTQSGEFPDADVVLWRADRDLVEREIDRRDLDSEV